MPDGSKRVFEYWACGSDTSAVDSIINNYRPGDKVRFKDGFTIPAIPPVNKKSR